MNAIPLNSTHKEFLLFFRVYIKLKLNSFLINVFTELDICEKKFIMLIIKE
jgi:hypothetical protein